MEYEKICKGCGSGNVIKKGKRKNKYGVVQKYFCNNCSKYFILKKLEKKVYSAKVIIQAISYYNLGYSLDESSKLINKKFKVKVSSRAISNWLNEFEEVCGYYRIRDKAKGLFKPKDIIFKKIFRHLQLYKFRYHKAKIEFFVNKYFNGLKDYSADVSRNCPNELFKDSLRSSNIKLDIDINKIKVFKKENYACKLASLALESASKNSERHDKLQEFMLANDTCTIATEVPVYLFLNEIKQYGVFDLFENSIKNNTLNKKPNNEKIFKNNTAITGHIDFVQLKFGSVYVLDYKPDADRVSAVSQLFVYALALSVRTGIWLRNFRCAWFDENGYYEFVPSDIVLRFCNVPQHRVREFFVRNKERRYFTSIEFHEKNEQGVE